MPFHRGTLMISGVMMWKSKSRDCRNLMWLQRRNLPCPRFPLRGRPRAGRWSNGVGTDRSTSKTTKAQRLEIGKPRSTWPRSMPERRGSPEPSTIPSLSRSRTSFQTFLVHERSTRPMAPVPAGFVPRFPHRAMQCISCSRRGRPQMDGSSNHRLSEIRSIEPVNQALQIQRIQSGNS